MEFAEISGKTSQMETEQSVPSEYSKEENLLEIPKKTESKEFDEMEDSRVWDWQEKLSEEVLQKRRHVLFASRVLHVLSKIISNRLFSVVREKKGLTYDISSGLLSDVNN